MAYIAPNSTIRLLTGLRINNTYQNTINFSSVSAQATYFTGKTKSGCVFTNQYYQRVGRNRIRLEKNAESVMDCNYLMFQNTSYGNKWFYAFILSVDYVNNAVCEITYQLDVMQTWHFDYTLLESFVKREHVQNDAIGANLETEPVECGEYQYNSYSAITNYSGDGLLIIVAVVDVDDEANGKVYQGIYGGATLYAYRADTDKDLVDAKIDEYLNAQHPDAIIGMYMCPALGVWDVNVNPTTHEVTQLGTTTGRSLPSLSTLSGNEALKGYTPRNKKLYTYPYNFYNIDNANGENLALRYEFFSNNAVTVNLDLCMVQPVTVTLRPRLYKGSASGTLNTESISLGNFPVCSWAYDAYQAWIAQNSLPVAVRGARTIGNAIYNFSAGRNGKNAAAMMDLMSGDFQSVAESGIGVGLANIGKSIFDAVVDGLMSAYPASIAADIAKGSPTAGNGNVSVGKQNFYGGRVSISAEKARIIDQFFDMYGYACNRVKIPDRTSRPYWNYVRTSGCNISGQLPSADIYAICSIYDNGIRFWKNGDIIGEFGYDNRIS